MPIDYQDPQTWRYPSPRDPGLHLVAGPENSAFRTLHVYRLNLATGMNYTLSDPSLELFAAVVSGSVHLLRNGETTPLNKQDAFYLPAGDEVELKARDGVVLYLAGAPDEGHGAFFVQPFDLSLPWGDIRQVHAEPPMKREVFISLPPQTPASRLLCGFSWNDAGGWSSWPPHEHADYFDEAYFYFDMPEPQFGLHTSYHQPGKPEFVHVVHGGDCVITPCGYQTNCSPPGYVNRYLFCAAVHKHEYRAEFNNLAVSDPNYVPHEAKE